jgi:CHAT domain-containing protein/tetratricopeptide (TPR) repeat protein
MQWLLPLLMFLISISSLCAQDEHEESRIQRLDRAIDLNKALIQKSKFNDALEVLQSSGELAASIAEEDTLRYARYLFNLGRTYAFRQELAEARRLYYQALRLQEKLQEQVVAEDLAWTLNNLGVLYMSLYMYDKSEQTHKRAMELRKKYLGTAHPDYVMSMLNMGVLKSNQGDYRQALQYYEQVRNLRLQIFGEQHPDYAQVLNNTGVVYKRMGQWELAEKNYLEAKEIYKTVYKDDHIWHANSLNNLANLYLFTKRYDEAEALYAESQRIYKRLFGEKHISFATGLNNIGQLKKKTKNLKEAEFIFREIRDFIDSTQGQSHRNYIQATHNLGEVLEEAGRYDESIVFLEEARDLRVEYLGRDHIDYASSMIDLSRLYEVTGNYAAAMEALLEAMRVLRLLLMNASRHLPENEQMFFIQKFREEIDRMYDFTLKYGDKYPDLARHCLDHTLFLKGFVQQSAIEFRHRVKANPEMEDAYLQYLMLQRDLSSLYARPVGKDDAIRTLENQVLDIERSLLTKVDIAEARFSKIVNTDSIRQALKPGEAAIEFVDFHRFDRKMTDSVQYAALLLRHGDRHPVMISLCSAEELHALIDIDSDRRSDYVNDLYDYAARSLVRLGGRKASLYELVWANIEKHGLEGIHTIFISPSGLLYRINIAAIGVSETDILSDRYQIVNMVSTRSICLPATQYLSADNKRILLLGGVDFDAGGPGWDDPDVSMDLLAVRNANPGRTRYGTWAPLIWTRKEVEQIHSTLFNHGYKVDLFTGEHASEDALKKAGQHNKVSPKIAHLATHGYFYAEPGEPEDTQDGKPAFMLSGHPMIRSGLILAGGNTTWTQYDASDDLKLQGEDGILTAFEISQLNLRNTELVVLSACETGLGDIQANEGVYGLQRAFKIAGVRYLIMSLWQVPDRATMTFMTEFYRNWLEHDLTITEAFRKTQRQMRDRFFNPYDWGGFILLE